MDRLFPVLGHFAQFHCSLSGFFDKKILPIDSPEQQRQVQGESN